MCRYFLTNLLARYNVSLSMMDLQNRTVNFPSEFSSDSYLFIVRIHRHVRWRLLVRLNVRFYIHRYTYHLENDTPIDENNVVAKRRSLRISVLPFLRIPRYFRWFEHSIIPIISFKRCVGETNVFIQLTILRLRPRVRILNFKLIWKV